MATQIKWTRQALEDIDSIARFIVKDSEYYATVQTERFFQRVKILEHQLEFGKIVPEVSNKDIRQLLEGNYRIIYQIISSQSVDILTVHHRSRLLSKNPVFEE